MDFKTFKDRYQKVPVIEYQHNRKHKKPLVTVKLVTYNHANFIEKCLNSILIQETSFDFEILIAEDDSSDGTREICINYAKNHPDKIRLLLNSRENNILINNKPSGNFNSIYANFCIDTKYINLIEGDDYWTDKKSLQKRIDFLENNDDFVLCFHNSKVYSEFEKKFKQNNLVHYKSNKIINPENIIVNSIPTSTLIYRNNLIEIFDSEMLNYFNGDLILKAKLSQFGKAMFLSNITDAVYRIHSNGIYGGASLKFQIENSIKTNQYLKKYFAAKKWNMNVVYNSFFICYFNAFFTKFFVEKKFDFIFLKQSIKYSRLAKKSFLIQFLSSCNIHLKRKLF